MKELLQRLREPSTWNAICILGGAIGFNIPAEYGQVLTAGCTFGLVIINAFWKKDSQSQPKSTGDGSV